MPSPVPFQPSRAIPCLSALRASNPVVHCLTNDVVQAFTANALLAVGACPAMVVAEEEVEAFAAAADALLINVGTLHSRMAHSMLLAVAAACAHGVPWVLDPVAVGILPYRAGVVERLLAFRPAAIRGNGAEVLALAGRASSAKGPDSQDSAFAALDAAEELAVRHGCVVAVTGETDFVTNGGNTLAIHGGHSNLTRITGAGCSLSAIVAAFLGSPQTDRLNAVASACLLMKAAGRAAAGAGTGLGSFAVAVLDHLSLPAERVFA